MAVQWPTDRLGVVNGALAQSGDNLCATENDGSDEWNVASSTYETALAFMLEDHGWVNQTKVVPNLAASPTAPTDIQFDTAFPIPADCMHLIWVRRDRAPAIYTILGGLILVRFAGMPGPVSIKYVSTDNSDAQDGTPTFVLALQTFVMAGIYRGLHEDLGEAGRVYQAALGILARAKATSDQQKPKTALFNSRLRMSRKVRRPWQPATNWSGTSNPGS